MANISLKGEDILLEEGKTYFVIDALYVNNIKENLHILDRYNVEKEIREKVFPYTETPFMSIFIPRRSDEQVKLSVSKIKRSKDGDDISLSFSSDTGLIVFIEISRLIDFSYIFDYDTLVDSNTAPINVHYWEQIEYKFGSNNCGLMLSPGINKGFDFDGSGLYKIEI